MSWMLAIIFFVGMYPVLFILYFMMKDAGKPQDGCCFAVHIEKEWLETDTIKAVQENYKKELKRIVQILALIPFVTLVLPTVSIPFTVWMLWIVAVCIVPFIPLARANEKLKAWKHEHGLATEQTHMVYTEMKSASGVRRVKLPAFLPPMLLSAGIAAFSIFYFCTKDLAVYAGMIVTFALITVMFYGIAVWMDNQKTQVISSDSDVNLNYARAKKNLWKNLWLWMAWMNTVYMAVMTMMFAVDLIATEWVLWGSIGYSVLTLIALIWFAKRMRAIEIRYEEKRENIFDDDDDAWIGGIIYYNKKDKRTMVPQRLGIGTTVNLATPAGMIWDIVGIAILLIVLPGCCIWMMLEEFTPIKLAVEENVLMAEQFKTDYEIPLDSIESIMLIDEKPNWKKVNGTGMDNICKGTFRVEGEKCKVFANPQNAVFMEIHTAEYTYYMSAADEAGTQEIYEEILEAWD